MAALCSCKTPVPLPNGLFFRPTVSHTHGLWPRFAALNPHQKPWEPSAAPAKQDLLAPGEGFALYTRSVKWAAPERSGATLFRDRFTSAKEVDHTPTAFRPGFVPPGNQHRTAAPFSQHDAINPGVVYRAGVAIGQRSTSAWNSPTSTPPGHVEVSR